MKRHPDHDWLPERPGGQAARLAQLGLAHKVRDLLERRLDPRDFAPFQSFPPEDAHARIAEAQCCVGCGRRLRRVRLEVQMKFHKTLDFRLGKILKGIRTDTMHIPPPLVAESINAMSDPENWEIPDRQILADSLVAAYGEALLQDGRPAAYFRALRTLYERMLNGTMRT